MSRIISIFTDLYHQFLIWKETKKICKNVSNYELGLLYSNIDLNFLKEKNWKKIIDDANRICLEEHQIFNYPTYFMIKWNEDPITKYKMPIRLSCKLIKVSHLYNKVDVKNFWEQSHLFAIVTLSESYVYTQNEKYSKKIIDILLDWQENNPCGKTINWKCSMDVGIRLVNICVAVGLARNSKYIKSIQQTIIKIIYQHIKYIVYNYENTGNMPNNHYISNLVGVIWGSVFLLRGFNILEVKKYLKDAINCLEKEIDRQVNLDGSDYENSTYYHCFVTELLSETICMLKKNGYSLSNSSEEKVKRMLGVCEYLGAFKGGIPIIGDQDGSRLFLLKGFFDINRCDFSSLKRFSRMEGNSKESGIYSINSDAFRAYIKCGNIGTGKKGTHDHNDQLSICVFAHELPLIIDGGTFLYTSDIKSRNLYRSELKHSMVFFDDISQNDIFNNIFSIKNGKGGIILNENPFCGEFIYSDKRKHIRKVYIENNILYIEDFISSMKEAKSRLFVPYNLDCITQIDMMTVIIETPKGKFNISSNSPIILRNEKYSPSYGIEKNCVLLECKINKIGKFFIKEN